jgi:hypothetical protein
MENQRLSFDMSIEDHKYLKMCCAKLGVSIKKFIIKATLEAVYAQEDIWFDELIQKQEEEQGENYVLIDHQGNFYDLSS